MKYLGAISDAKDLVNKEYVDGLVGKVTQTADTTNTWRKVLGTYNGNTSSADGTITSGASNVTYYDADGPAFNTSTGELYTKGYLMYLTSSDALYTAIDDLGWLSEVTS